MKHLPTYQIKWARYRNYFGLNLVNELAIPYSKLASVMIFSAGDDPRTLGLYLSSVLLHVDLDCNCGRDSGVFHCFD